MFIMLLTIEISSMKDKRKGKREEITREKLLREKVAVWDAQLKQIQ